MSCSTNKGRCRWSIWIRFLLHPPSTSKCIYPDYKSHHIKQKKNTSGLGVIYQEQTPPPLPANHESHYSSTGTCTEYFRHCKVNKRLLSTHVLQWCRKREESTMCWGTLICLYLTVIKNLLETQQEQGSVHIYPLSLLYSSFWIEGLQQILRDFVLSSVCKVTHVSNRMNGFTRVSWLIWKILKPSCNSLSLFPSLPPFLGVYLTLTGAVPTNLNVHNFLKLSACSKHSSCPWGMGSFAGGVLVHVTCYVGTCAPSNFGCCWSIC